MKFLKINLPILLVTVLTALSLFVSCTKQQENQQESLNRKTQLGSSDKDVQSLKDFWSIFRTAVLSNNKKAIASITQFPFVAAYSPEGSPVFSHNSGDFPLILDILLNLKGKLHNLPISSYELIKESETPPKINNNNQFTVGVFKFNKIGDRWFLTGAQVHEYPKLIATGPEGTPQQSIQDFWNEFRHAVLSNDKEAIVSMTSFPFFTQGPTDDYPIVTHKKRENFTQILDSLLDSTINVNEKPELMRSFIVNNRNIAQILASANDGSRNFQEVCYVLKNFTFWKMYGKWYFSEAEHTGPIEQKDN